MFQVGDYVAWKVVPPEVFTAKIIGVLPSAYQIIIVAAINQPETVGRQSNLTRPFADTDCVKVTYPPGGGGGGGGGSTTTGSSIPWGSLVILALAIALGAGNNR